MPKEVELSLQAEFNDDINKLIPENCILGDIVFSKQAVKVTGPASEINRIKKVVASVNIAEKLEKNTTFIPEIKFVTDDGSKLVYSEIDADSRDITMSIPILKKVTLPASITFKSAPTSFASAPLNYTVSPSSITAAVPIDLVDTLKSISVATIDFADITKGINVFNISSADIEDIMVIPATASAFRVTVDASNMAAKTVSIPASRARVSNKLAKYVIENVDSGNLTFTLIGEKEALDTVNADDIVLNADMQSVKINENVDSLPVIATVSNSKCTAEILLRFRFLKNKFYFYDRGLLMKKKIFAYLIILICICLLFAGCDFSFLPAAKLIRPPKLSGESSFLQQEFEKEIANEFVKMKTPLKGENRSSYIIFDIDNDGNDDGLVFYSDPSVDELARVAVFKHNGNEWKNVSILSGLGEEIYEVGFSDINGDGNYEVLISWTNLNPDSSSNETLTLVGNRILTLYKFGNSAMTLLKTEDFTKMYVSDFNGDGSDDIFLSTVSISNDSKKTTGRIIIFKDDCTVEFDKSFSLIGMLDIVSITSDIFTNGERQYTRIYVDGILSEAAYVTDVIQYSVSTGGIALPLHSLSAGTVPATARSNKLCSIDINDDGMIEIPTLIELPFSKRIGDAEDYKENSLNLVVWSQLQNKKIAPVLTTLYNNVNNFYFIFDDKWISNITAVYNSNSSLLVFYAVENGAIADKLFSIMTFSRADWNDDNYDFDLLFDGDAYVYGYIYEPNKYISKQEVRDNFVAIY